MQNRRRDRSSRTDRLVLTEDDQARSPSYFEWREQTIRTTAFRPAPKPQPKLNPIVRLFRRFG